MKMKRRWFKTSNIRNESRKLITDYNPYIYQFSRDGKNYGFTKWNKTYQHEVVENRDTLDKVYLLSLNEVNSNNLDYLGSTNFAASRSNGGTLWWLRTPISNYNNAFVEGGDVMLSEGQRVQTNGILVRPVIQVDLNLIVK